MRRPDQLDKVEINWSIPLELIKKSWDKIKIYRSLSENEGYSLYDTIDAVVNNNYVNSYIDLQGTRNFYYLVTFYSTQRQEESDWLNTYFSLNPTERRLVERLKESIPPIIQRQITNEYCYRDGLQFGIDYINMFPPKTNFTIFNYPKTDGFESLLLLGGFIGVVLKYFLVISIRDFSYSTHLTLSVNRGEKINQAIEEVLKIFNKLLEVSKFNYASKGHGVGTILLPLSLGGMIHARLLNVFDILRMAI